jgi:hypothetical protein
LTTPKDPYTRRRYRQCPDCQVRFVTIERRIQTDTDPTNPELTWAQRFAQRVRDG